MAVREKERERERERETGSKARPSPVDWPEKFERLKRESTLIANSAKLFLEPMV